MILICSEENDYSTVEVERWLRFCKVDYLRINKEDKIEISLIDISNNSIQLYVGDSFIDLKNISTFWYRRGFFDFTKDTNLLFSRIYKSESFDLNAFLFKYLLDNTYSINNYLFSNVNKLLVLQEAKKIGLKIPKTIVTGLKIVARDFVDSSGGAITKATGSQIMIQKRNTIWLGYTETFTSQYLEKFDERFFPSLIQNRVKKKFEIRTFLLNNTFYSMAIFSQANNSTSTDFRKYDSGNPNRTVPYKLPLEVENKLLELFAKLRLNNGSADIILDEFGEYIFLEINPVGQFGMVSKPCNYYLERLISQNLTSYD